MRDQSEEKLLLAGTATGEGEDRGWHKAVDAVFDKNPTFLRLLEKVEIVGLILEMHICFYDEAHHDVEETYVVNEVVDYKEELPPKGLFMLNQRCDPSWPGLRRGKLVEEGQSREDIWKILIREPSPSNFEALLFSTW